MAVLPKGTAVVVHPQLEVITPRPPPLGPCLQRRSAGCQISVKRTGCSLSTQLLSWKKYALRASNKLGSYSQCG